MPTARENYPTANLPREAAAIEKSARAMLAALNQTRAITTTIDRDAADRLDEIFIVVTAAIAQARAAGVEAEA